MDTHGNFSKNALSWKFISKNFDYISRCKFHDFVIAINDNLHQYVRVYSKFMLEIQHMCCNLSFGLATKAKGLQGCGPKGSPGVTSETPGSVGECEGVSPHTP